MWIKFRVCLAIIAQLLLPSREVASREINCHARRSRDKRINSSRNEADKNCLRSRLLNYGRDIIRLPRLWRKVQRFLLLLWAKNFNEFCNLRIQRNDLTYSLWRRERRRKNWKWLSRDGVKSRTCCEYPVDILYIEVSFRAWHFVADYFRSLRSRHREEFEVDRAADPSENLHKLSISSSSSSSSLDPETTYCRPFKRDAAITFPSSRRRRRYSLPANNNAWVGWAGFQSFLSDCSCIGSCEIHTTIVIYDPDWTISHWIIETWTVRSGSRYY